MPLIPRIPETDKAAYAVLFPSPVRRKLIIAVVGSIVVSMIEAGAIVLLLPLMQVMAGSADSTGVIEWLRTILPNPTTNRLMLVLAGAVLAAFVAKDLFTLAFRWWMLGFINRQTVHGSTHVLAYFLHAPYLTHVQRSMADMMRSVSDTVGQFYGRTVSGAIGVVTEAATILTILVGMVVAIPVPALAVIAYFALASVLFLRYVKPRAEAEGQIQLQSGFDAFEAVIHSFGGIKEIKVRHAQPHFLDRFYRASMTRALSSRKSSFLQEAPKYLFEVLFIVAIALLTVVVQASGQSVGVIGTLAIMAGAAFRILPSLTRLVAALTAVRTGEPARKLLLTELAEERDQLDRQERVGSAERMPLRREIAFDRVGFTFPDATEPVLKDLSFTVSVGSSVAFVGGSGSGKTTTANLLMGLLEPTTGTITVDGVDIAPRLYEWQNNIAFVPQDVFHMDLPFRENIAFDQYARDIDEARLQRALEQAQLLDLVAQLPHGLDTRIGDRGIRLSGGQLQRIGIARALYRNPSLLVLDEATSALDNETELRITDTIRGLQGSMTIVVIAHRLSTVKHVDRIFFLDRGRIVDQGTFAELTSRNASFAALVELGHLG